MGFTVTFVRTAGGPGGPKHFDTPPKTYDVRPDGTLTIHTAKVGHVKAHSENYAPEYWIPPVVDDP